MRIGSSKHQLQIIKVNKVSLSSFDDKRLILEDGISTLPFGHSMIRDVHVTQDIFDEPDWRYEEDETTTSPTWDELNSNDPRSTITQVFPEKAPMPPDAPLPTQFRGRSRSSDEEAMTLT